MLKFEIFFIMRLQRGKFGFIVRPESFFWMGRGQAVKAPVFGIGIRRFESSRPSHHMLLHTLTWLHVIESLKYTFGNIFIRLVFNDKYLV